MIHEAQHSLSSSLKEGNLWDVSSGDIDEDSERLDTTEMTETFVGLWPTEVRIKLM
jgi:hypothetical protein